MTTIEQAHAAVSTVSNFMHPMQLSTIGDNCRGEEGEFFKAKLVELGQIIDTMPVTYEQDGKGDNAIAHLHYFVGGWDWYITEKDVDGGVQQAFGLVFGHESELGYISITELVNNGAELDLHFASCRLADIKAEKRAA